MENANPVGKAANSAIQALAVLYKECHKMYPDSPACQAVQDIMTAVSEVERTAMTGEGQMDPAGQMPAPDAPMPAPEAEMPTGDEVPMGPEGPLEEPPAIQELDAPPMSMRDAAAGLREDMISAAERRKNG